MVKSENLKAARALCSMTQEETGKMLGISKETYRNKERGKCSFSPKEISMLCWRFGWNYRTMNETFFGGELPHFFAQEVPFGITK